MTANEFRQLALQIPGAVESSHMKHPDFRVEGKVFASLGYPDKDHGMVKFTPEQQEAFTGENPAVFRPCAGSWGKQGSTSVRLVEVDEEVLRAALETAARNVHVKQRRKKL